MNNERIAQELLVAARELTAIPLSKFVDFDMFKKKTSKHVSLIFDNLRESTLSLHHVGEALKEQGLDGEARDIFKMRGEIETVIRKMRSMYL